MAKNKARFIDIPGQPPPEKVKRGRVPPPVPPKGTRWPGAGVKKGAVTAPTIKRNLAIANGLEIAQRYGIYPLEAILCRLTGQNMPNGNAPPTDQQFEAAIAAAPYIHPRLSAIAFQPPKQASRIDVSVLTQEERAVLLSALRRGFVKPVDPVVEGPIIEGDVSDAPNEKDE